MEGRPDSVGENVLVGGPDTCQEIRKKTGPKPFPRMISWPVDALSAAWAPADCGCCGPIGPAGRGAASESSRSGQPRSGGGDEWAPVMCVAAGKAVSAIAIRSSDRGGLAAPL